MARTLSPRGFTLIEVLLVVSIIALLSTIIASTFSAARVYARDTRRVADLRSVAVALQLYANDHNGNYPAGSGDQHGCSGTGCLTALIDELVPGYISQVPIDPVFGSTNDGYRYCQANGGASYQLVTRLETQDDNGWCTVPGIPPVSGTSCWTTNGVPDYPVCDPGSGSGDDDDGNEPPPPPKEEDPGDDVDTIPIDQPPPTGDGGKNPPGHIDPIRDPVAPRIIPPDGTSPGYPGYVDPIKNPEGE